MSDTDAGKLKENISLMEALRAYGEPKIAMMLVLGFTAGLPFLLYFSTLSVWLKESKIEEATIGFFSWFGLAYSFKFFWAPLIDKFDPPGLSKMFGRRRAWIFVAQIGIALAMLGIGFSDPTKSLWMTALFSFLLAFSSATQDIGIDGWRIEAAENDDEQATLAAAYQYGYKVGMVISGGVALFIAGSTNFTIAYWTMAATMALGAVIFAMWDRKSGLQSAAAAGVLLLSVGLWAAFNAFNSIVAENSTGDMVTSALAFFFLIAAGVASMALIFFLSQSMRDKSSPTPVTVSGILVGVLFTIILFSGLTAFAAGIAWSIASALDAFGIELTKGQIRWLALSIAALPILACAIAIPLIRRVPETSEKLTHPAYGAFVDFFWRHGWAALLILLFVSSYRLSDIVMGIMAKPAYVEMGYSAADIGLVSGTFGPWVIFIGVALAGISAIKFGLRTSLIIGAIVSVLGNVIFAWLVNQPADSLMPLFIAVTADNIAGGYAGTIFVAFLSTMVNKSFAGTQYAIFSSIYTLGPKLVAGTSGIFVEEFGYTNFFLYAAALGLPAIILSVMAGMMKPDREAPVAVKAA